VLHHHACYEPFVTAADRKLLVLDIDETLIYASPIPLHRPAHFPLGLAHAYIRPGAHKFITTCRQHYHVGIWTSATREYAADVLVRLNVPLNSLAFIWTREHCVGGENTITGHLCRVKQFPQLLALGYPASAITVVDDEPGCWLDCTGRLLAIPKYKGAPEDRELYRLLGLLTP